MAQGTSKRKGIDVRVIRRRAGLTQQEFAQKLGTHRRTVQSWEVDQMDKEISEEANRKIEEFLERIGGKE